MFLKQCARQFGTNRENFCVSDVCVHKLSKDKKKKLKTLLIHLLDCPSEMIAILSFIIKDQAVLF